MVLAKTTGEILDSEWGTISFTFASRLGTPVVTIDGITPPTGESTPDGSVSLSWQAVDGAESYRIELAEDYQPDSPGSVSATEDEGEVTITWTPPPESGFELIEENLVSTSFTISNLLVGEYTVSVIAKSVGSVDESERGLANFTLLASVDDGVAFCGEWYSDPPNIVVVNVFRGDYFN